MSKTKKLEVTSAGLGVALALFVSPAVLAGCDLDASGSTTTRSQSVGERRADDPKAAPVTPEEVIEPREGRFDVKDYVATEGPFRLFGTEEGDGTRPRTAIIADARGWSARAYAEGELVGRGMRVAKVEGTTVTLRGANGDLVLDSGENVQLRVVRHKLDIVARPLGKHRYELDPAAARATKDVLPTFEVHELYGESVIKLGPVEPGTLFAEVDLREGDLIVMPEGTTTGESALEEIRRSLTDGRPHVSLRVYRGGIPLDRTYDAIAE